MTYEIFIPKSLKGKRIRSLYTFIYQFQAVDWKIFYYGFGVDQEDLEERQKCGSIPSNYGCILFVNFHLDATKFIEYVKGDVDSDTLVGIRGKIDEDEYIDINEWFERDQVRKVATSHPTVVSSVELELLVPVVITIDTLPEDIEETIALFEQQANRMKAIWDYYRNRPPPILDAEIHQWDTQYVDPAKVEGYITDLSEERNGQEFDIEFFAEEVHEDVEDAPEQPSYMLILRLEQDATLTIKKLEKVIDQALAPIKQHISKQACVANLV